tara:strand:- start:879 stop:1220 length:342 start_codon:yes stop_codon:yes gene_type:complete
MNHEQSSNKGTLIDLDYTIPNYTQNLAKRLEQIQTLFIKEITDYLNNKWNELKILSQIYSITGTKYLNDTTENNQSIENSEQTSNLSKIGGKRHSNTKKYKKYKNKTISNRKN